jgi:DNA-binding HxlR family transcriptional regulator
MANAQTDCPLIALIDVIGGRWKVMAMWELRDGTKRFSELKRGMPGVTQKMLTQQLRQLEADGLGEGGRLCRGVLSHRPWPCASGRGR